MSPVVPVLVVAALLPGLVLAEDVVPARRIRVAFMEMRPLGTEAATAEMLSEVALTEASRVAGLEVIGMSDIAGLLGFERHKAMLGCGEESSCIAEIAGALGVDYLVLGSLGRLGALFRVDLKLVDARRARVLGRAGESVGGEEERLVGTVQRGVRELLAAIAPARGAPASGAAAPKAPAVAVSPSPFEGGWDVTVDCEAAGMGRRYSAELAGAITGGVLLASRGSPGVPGFLRLEGPVRPDGTARLQMTGLTGFRGPRSPGSPLQYGVEARFEKDRGTGTRLDQRPCKLTFTRR